MRPALAPFQQSGGEGSEVLEETLTATQRASDVDTNIYRRILGKERRQDLANDSGSM